MAWAALTSGGKDSILSCQKAIDSGKDGQVYGDSPPEKPSTPICSTPPISMPSRSLPGLPVWNTWRLKRREPRRRNSKDLEEGLAALDIEGVIRRRCGFPVPG